MIDEVKFPLTAKYIGNLPQGLLSYPECKVKSDVYEKIRSDFPDLPRGLPKIIQDYIDGLYSEEWYPEVAANALLMILRDSVFTSDDAFLQWNYDNNIALFHKPHYRVIMRITSVTIVAMGAGKRWRTYHEGSSLEPEPVKAAHGRNYVELKLSYPENLFNDLLINRVRNTFKATIDSTSAVASDSKIKEQHSDYTIIEGSWQEA